MSKVLRVRGRSEAEVEAAALACVHNFCPELLTTPKPFPLEAFLDKKAGLKGLYGFNFYVDDDEDVDVNTEGFINPLTRELVLPFETFEKLGANDGRARFTVAHEIGHTALHADQVKGRFTHGGDVTLHRRGDIPAYEDPEWQANTFASYLLMPTAPVRQVLATGAGATKLASVFAVSFAAAEIRIKRLQKRR